MFSNLFFIILYFWICQYYNIDVIFQQTPTTSESPISFLSLAPETIFN